ncbi:MAG: glycosyltransferase [Anaerolineae bacterium]
MKKTLYAAITIFLFIGGGICLKKWYDYRHVQPHLSVVGFIKMADGLGRQSVELISALKDDICISFIPSRKSNLKDIPKDTREIVAQKYRRQGKVLFFEDCLWLPGGAFYKKLSSPKKEDQIRISYSMFESTKIPSEWVVILNTYFDAVAVPDKFLIDIYKNCGVTIPIFTLPLGLNIDPLLKMPLKRSRGHPMTFANFSVCDDRKNQLTLVRAFVKAFGKNNQNVRLLINCRRSDDKKIAEAIRREIEEEGLYNVIFSELCLEKDAYLKLFQTVDCYVSLSKGEGFSIQPREAMALGIPVIATSNTAQKTICESNLVRSVASNIRVPASYPWTNATYGHSFDCEIEDAAQALLDVFEHYDLYLQKAEQSRNWAGQYDYKNLKPFYKTLINPQEVILGEKNQITENALFTDSKELYEKYLKLRAN